MSRWKVHLLALSFAAQLKVSSLTSLEVSVDRGRNGGAGGAGMRRVNLLWLKLV